MARTGSGKSLAFLIPLIQRLGGRHSSTFGARALILLPTRELALQILKVGKELARGWRDGEGEHAGDKGGDDHSESQNRGQGLRWGLVVGGEGMDEQFEMISCNPDMYAAFFPNHATDPTDLTGLACLILCSIIATPGRLLHLVVEMNLDLRSVQYVVFDEADRLFEMGFETALTEIIHRLPASRQTLLFSATLPKSLVDFAKAGLQNPKLVRLDAESKISADLRMAFFSVKQDEKDACLLLLLRDIIQVPWDATSHGQEECGAEEELVAQDQFTSPHQTLVFAATKHHVEYLTTLLTAAGYAVSYIYGSLDQSARTRQMDQFRRGRTNILVVTDVAARGIDIPVLANVVNYDFPPGARVFVHRVGRTARAGRSGWAWSFVGPTELPYLIELQLFLGRPLTRHVAGDGEAPYAENLVLGAFPREALDDEVYHIRALEAVQHALPTLRNVMRKGQGMYERSRGRASPASYTRAKEMSREPAPWGLVAAGTHPVFRLKDRAVWVSPVDEDERRRALLAAVDSFRPVETALEIGSRGKTGNAELMKGRRKALSKAMDRREKVQVPVGGGGAAENEDYSRETGDVEMADSEDIDVRSTIVSCAHRPYQFRRPPLAHTHQSPRRGNTGNTMTRNFIFPIVRLVLIRKKGAPNSDSSMLGSRSLGTPCVMGKLLPSRHGMPRLISPETKGRLHRNAPNPELLGTRKRKSSCAAMAQVPTTSRWSGPKVVLSSLRLTVLDALTNGGPRHTRAFLASARLCQNASIQVASVSNIPRSRLQNLLINSLRTMRERSVSRRKWRLPTRWPGESPLGKDRMAQRDE